MWNPFGSHREPSFSDYILDAVGHGFSVGAVGGSTYHFLRGLYRSPSGERFTGAANAVRMHVPHLGCSFAVFAALYSAFNYSLIRLRHKEDLWNSVAASAAAGGLLEVHRGPLAAGRAALHCGTVLMGVILMRERIEGRPAPAPAWFGNLFGGGFDSPAQPSFNWFKRS